MASTEVQQKKRPGRPKGEPKLPTTNINGVVDTPSDSENIIELIYCVPILFKKILLLMKQYEVGEINFIFSKESITMLAVDRVGKSIINILINGNNLNHYYCKSQISVFITRSNLETSIGQLNKNHDKLTFILRENYRSIMYIIVHDEEYNNENIYEISVCQSKSNEIIEEIPRNFAITFTMSMQHFKAVINNARRTGDIMAIQKTQDKTLQLTTLNTQKVTWTNIYNDSNKLLLVNNLAENEILSVSVEIEYIRPIANSNIGNYVNISCGHSDKLLIIVLLYSIKSEPTCTINVITNIREFKN